MESSRAIFFVRVKTVIECERVSKYFAQCDLIVISGINVYTNVYKPFADLFASATHTLCDLHMKNNVKSKHSDLNFNPFSTNVQLM